ncbi:MAG: PLP-dependent aminotransferase family protein [Desulfurococcales archaeon]|nr:PLP-dependent aminotransferase family protein [Desulfurococcales archaeon]
MVEARRFYAGRMKYVKTSDIREILKLTEGREIISLAGGLPDPRVFPRDELVDIMRSIVEENLESALQYSPTKGVTPFREVLKGFMNTHGVKVRGWDDVMVTTGSQQSLFLMAQVLLDSGDVVLIEEPGYLAAINVFTYARASMAGVPVDSEGMDTTILEEKVKRLKSEGKRVKLIYTNPTSQNPTGSTMSLERRKHLLEIASTHDLLVIEDDPYSFFTFEEGKPPYLKTLDNEGRVLYTSTFSKILMPGVRLGWTLADKDIVAGMESLKQMVDLHSATLSQYIAMESIKRGIVDRTIDRARMIYKAKRDALIETLEEELTGIASWTKPIGGFFTMVYLHPSINARQLLVEAVERKGVAFVPGDSFFVERKMPNTMRLSYSFPPEDVIRIGARRLAELVKEKTPR